MSLFTRLQRTERPLEALLDRWSVPARRNAEDVHVSRFEGKNDSEIVDSLLPEWRRAVDPPLARIGEPGLTQEPYPDRQDEAPESWRWIAEFHFEGNTELLKSWPSGFESTCADDATTAAEGEMYWSEASDGCIVYVRTSVRSDPGGTEVPKAAFVEAAHYLDEFVAAVNTHVADYGQRLCDELALVIAHRRERLGIIAAQNVQVVELLRKPLKPLELAFLEESPTDAESPREVQLTPVLKETTFAGLVSVTRRWGDAVERYPEAFRELGEEALSCLLVATLNIAFDTAQREVFNVGGKTDIYVEVVRGSRENAAFFGEAKIWHGQARVAKDVVQLLDYSGSRTAEAMLLYYVKSQRLTSVRSAWSKAMQTCEGFVRFSGGKTTMSSC